MDGGYGLLMKEFFLRSKLFPVFHIFQETKKIMNKKIPPKRQKKDVNNSP